MAGELVSEYRTAGGQRVLVEQHASPDGKPFYSTDCTGCTAGGIESTHNQSDEQALGAAETWARSHAAACRRRYP